jgi:hypothetical protein
VEAWIWLGVSVLAALLVWLDARRLGMTYGGPTGRDGGLGAPGWAVVTLLFPIFAVPVYLWRRRRWRPRATSEE